MGPRASGSVNLLYLLVYYMLDKKIVTANSSLAHSWLTVNGIHGLFQQSRAHPREIMTEVLKALQELNVCWKKIGHYNMKCRWDPMHKEGPTNDNGMQSSHYFGDESANIVQHADIITTSPNVVKFEVQVTQSFHHF